MAIRTPWRRPLTETTVAQRAPARVAPIARGGAVAEPAADGDFLQDSLTQHELSDPLTSQAKMEGPAIHLQSAGSAAPPAPAGSAAPPDPAGNTTPPAPGGGAQGTFDAAVSGGRAELPYRAQMERSFGQSFAGVEVHTGQALQMKALGANAATQGERVAFATPNPGPELVAHELTHVVQQRQAGGVGAVQGNGVSSPNDASEQEANQVAQLAAQGRPVQVHARPSAGIQRNYSGLSTMDKARVDTLAEKKYAEKTEAYEFAMGPVLSKDPASLQGADTMLGIFKKMVDAWAKSTGQTNFFGQVKDSVYEKEFAFATSEKYYGSFQKTGSSIKKVFSKSGQPLRKKFHLIYNAVRNNNLSKYLKLAAMELETASKTGKKSAQSLMEHGKSSTGKDTFTQQTVKSGFAKGSGLDKILARTGKQKEIAEAGESEKVGFTDGSRQVVSSQEGLGRSKIMNWSDDVADSGSSRRGGKSSHLKLHEQRQLNVEDVDDLTSSEIRNLYKRRGEQVPGMSLSDKKKYKKDRGGEKIGWEQGREYYDVTMNSAVDKQAAKFHSRLEAGVSGSTDLMLHAAQQLGMSKADMYKLRLALNGWMLSNRDHSFYEIMRAAQSYGLDFEINEGHVGGEYHHPTNFKPMNPGKLRGLLPEKKYPAYFMSKSYKDILAGHLGGKGQSADKFRDALIASGLPRDLTDEMDERDVAELTALVDAVSGAKTKFDTSGTEEANNTNRTQLRMLQENTAYMYLARKFPVWGDMMLKTMIKTHVGDVLTGFYKDLPDVAGAEDQGLSGDAIRAKAYLTGDAGIHRTHIERLQEHELFELMKFAHTVRATPRANFPMPVLTEDDMNKASAQRKRWESSPLLEPLKRYGAVWKTRVIQCLIERLFVATPEQRLAQDTRLQKIMEIAQDSPTSGTWYSWGALAYLQSYAGAGSIKEHALGTDQNSNQGPGLYVAHKPTASASYGDRPDGAMLLVHMTSVPTITRSNSAQAKRLREEVTYRGGGMTLNDLYSPANLAEYLLRYGAAYARLTANAGVKLSFDVSTMGAGNLKDLYKTINSTANKTAAQMLKKQAKYFKVDTKDWDT
jgi:Domain of unknown function (DUF4157)